MLIILRHHISILLDITFKHSEKSTFLHCFVGFFEYYFLFFSEFGDKIELSTVPIYFLPNLGKTNLIVACVFRETKISHQKLKSTSERIWEINKLLSRFTLSTFADASRIKQENFM
jgi:hypothetical protein